GRTSLGGGRRAPGRARRLAGGPGMGSAARREGGGGGGGVVARGPPHSRLPRPGRRASGDEALGVSRISVLTYHSIDRSGSVLSVSPEEFQEHVEQVARSERPVLAPSRLAWPLGEEPGFSGDGFAFTFDDGYASVAEHAAPLLARHGFPYGVFLVTSRIGSTNQWPGQAAWVAPAPLLDWDAVGKLVASGAEIGAHTSGHADLS